ncbi:MAG TPA: undecaprenyl-diphosphate phosphatase [Sulfurimonas sp. UBA12504]|nr:MAG: undecaprenyl-diphosphatase [Sulfurimonas sp. GWF2_37_8]DAB30702.1 MAG TPA: undecaprenyl-diphosphate phosphatase [Sulfurimonas sp. UBA12504]
MTLFDSIILGIVEGFTEFLPISSTGHLIVASELLGLDQNAATKAYEVIIQFAAILAVVMNYKDKFTFKKIDLWTKVFVAFLPIGAVGYIFANQIKELFSVEIVAIMFIIGGIVFLIVEKFFLKDETQLQEDVEQVTMKQSIIIGLAQVLALIPGTSRAGSTIIGALLIGLSRKASAEFSFLLALPVMSAVAAYDLLKHYKEFSDANIMTLGVGFVVSFFVAYLTIKLFMKFLEKFTFVAFGIYRILFGVILLLIIN